MARPLRVEYPGALWHVTSRGNEKRDIVRDDVDRRRFVELLARVVERSDWRLFAWVLMSNHYHLFLETPRPNLSDGIHLLNQCHAQKFNKRHDRVGHLFQGRFKGILVEREGHLLELLRYVVLNPVRACMVQDVSDYPWSSYRATAGLASVPKWLDVKGCLAQFHPRDQRTAQSEYQRFVDAGRGAPRPWDKVSGQIFLGGDAFRESVQKRIDGMRTTREHPRTQVRPALIGLDAIASDVSDELHIAQPDIRRRVSSRARAAFVAVAVGAGHSLSSIATWLGNSPAAVARLRDVSQKISGSDSVYRMQIERIRKTKLKNET